MKVGDKFKVVKDPQKTFPDIYFIPGELEERFTEGVAYEIWYSVDMTILRTKEIFGHDISHLKSGLFNALPFVLYANFKAMMPVCCCEVIVEEKKCTCDIITLLQNGCKCGGT